MKKFLLILLVGLAFSSCKKDENEETLKDYGNVGTHEVQTYKENTHTTVFYPKDIASLEKKSPLIFFGSGWSTTDANEYKSLLNFVASHGYTIIFTDEGQSMSAQHSIDGYDGLLNSNQAKDKVFQYVDFTKIGVVGISAGGGATFPILDHYSKEKGYGTNGRFIMALDPWYALGLDEDDMKGLPSNTNVIIMKYGVRGYNDADGTDARIPLTEYALLESIPAKNKDYQVYENADHNYPKETNIKEGLLKPLEALMDYTFNNQSEIVRKAALENGSDDPYSNGNGIQLVKPKGDYKYPCDGANTKIDYCSIID